MGDTPEAAVGIRLHKTVLGTETVEVDGASLATVDADRRQALKSRHFRQAALAAAYGSAIVRVSMKLRHAARG